MKKYASCLFALAALASCTEDAPQPAVPSVELTAGKATASSLSFTLTPKDARRAAYVAVKKGEPLPDAAAVIEKGFPAGAAEAGEYSVAGLEAAAGYVIAAAASNGDILSETAVLEMTTAENPAPDVPVVRIIPGEAAFDALAFTVECSANADRAAYVCVEKGTPLPGTAAELLEAGTAVDPSSGEVSAEGLAGGTTYVIAAAAAAGETLSETAVLEMTTGDTQMFEPKHVGGGYFGNPLTDGRSIGQYALSFTDAPLSAGGGYIVGPGNMFGFILYSEEREERNAVPQSGEYSLPEELRYEKFRIDPRSYWAIAGDDGNYVDNGHFSAASITVSSPAEGVWEYTVDFACELGKYRIEWRGEMEWENRTPVPPVDVGFTAAKAVLYYTGPVGESDADEWRLDLYGPDAFFSMPFYSRAVADRLSPVLPSGTYTVNAGGTPEPGTFIPGDGNLGGTFFQGNDANGIFRTLYCSGGSFAVSGGSGGYTITGDFVTTAGVKATWDFAGEAELHSYYRPPYEGLLEINATHADKDALFYYGYGGTNSYYIQLVDCDFGGGFVPAGGGPGNRIFIDVLSDTTPDDMDNIVVPDGTYALSDSGADGTFTSFCYHWDENGALSVVNAASGTLTVSRAGNIYTLDIDAVTDSNMHYTCAYEGEIPVRDARPGASARPGR